MRAVTLSENTESFSEMLAKKHKVIVGLDNFFQADDMISLLESQSKSQILQDFKGYLTLMGYEITSSGKFNPIAYRDFLQTLITPEGRNTFIKKMDSIVLPTIKDDEKKATLIALLEGIESGKYDHQIEGQIYVNGEKVRKLTGETYITPATKKVRETAQAAVGGVLSIGAIVHSVGAKIGPLFGQFKG